MKTSPKAGPEKRKKRRQRNLVRKNLRQSFQALPFIVPLIATAFIYTWLYTRTNIIALPIEGLRVEKVNLLKHNDTLRLNIEQLQAPHRIEAIARKKLGMISPEIWQVVVLDKPVRAPQAAVQLAGAAEPLESDRLLGSLRAPDAGPSARVSPQDSGQPG